MFGMGNRATARGRARTFAAVSLTAALIVSACGSDDDDTSTATDESTPSATEDSDATASTTAEETSSEETMTSEAVEPATVVTVNAGVPPLTNFAPVLWGIEQGFFEEEGIDLQLNEEVAGTAVVPAVAAGQLDVGVTVWPGMIPAVAQDLPLMGFAGVFEALTAEDPATDTEDTIGLVVLNDSGIETAADLAGKTIAVPNVASLAAIEVHEIAGRAGLEVGDYDLVQVDFPNMTAALRSGQVDAAYVTEPFLTPLRTSDDAHVIPGATQGSVAPGQPAGVMVANAAWAAENPELVAALQRAARRSADYAQEHIDELRAALPDLLGLDPAVADTIVLPIFTAEFEVEDVQDIADTLLQYEILQEPLDVSENIIPMP